MIVTLLKIKITMIFYLEDEDLTDRTLLTFKVIFFLFHLDGRGFDQ